jgi:hypothetical protein
VSGLYEFSDFFELHQALYLAVESDAVIRSRPEPNMNHLVEQSELQEIDPTADGRVDANYKNVVGLAAIGVCGHRLIANLGVRKLPTKVESVEASIKSLEGQLTPHDCPYLMMACQLT